MRQGLLFQMEGSMSSIGQTGQIGDGQSLILLYSFSAGKNCITDT